MSVINTNTKSLFAQNALTANNRSLSKAMEQLSTGKRINTASDDAAGLAIASKMTSQIRGLDQAVRNANDAVSMLQTAEGGMIEITNMQQRMRELAIQAANDTNTSEDREYLDLEFQQLRQEIGRIAGNTQWNGMNIIDGSFTENKDKGLFQFQVGANTKQTISVKMADMSAIPGLDAPPNGDISLKVDINATGAASTDARVLDFTGTEPVKDQTFFVKIGEGVNAAVVSYTAKADDDLEKVVKGIGDAIGLLTLKNATDKARAITVSQVGNSLVLTEKTADGGVGDEAIEVTSFMKLATDAEKVPGTTDKNVITLTGGKLEIDLRGVDVTSGQSFQVVLGAQTFEYKAVAGDTIEEVAAGLAKAINGSEGFEKDLISTSAGSTLVVQNGTEATFKLADKSATPLTVGMVFVTTGAVAGTNSNANITTSNAAQSAIANLDLAIEFVNEQRSMLGAMINRLTYASDNLANISMNTSASRSRVEDTDYAKASAELARTQIISQAATAMLAQANQQPQAVLQLLQG
jgi:flagellin